MPNSVLRRTCLKDFDAFAAISPIMKSILIGEAETPSRFDPLSTGYRYAWKGDRTKTDFTCLPRALLQLRSTSLRHLRTDEIYQS